MASETERLRKDLKKAGLSEKAIEAAWPSWWSDEAEGSRSARAELRFIVARNLGLSPQSLFHDEVRFVWRDEARFKHLTDEGAAQKSVIASFGYSIGRLLIDATSDAQPPVADPLKLRQAILASQMYVDLESLLAFCWSVGIPVVHLRVFALKAKHMHAMVVRVGSRFAILLGRDASYPAPIAFSLAHELGHIGRGHILNTAALVEVGDPLRAQGKDEDEEEVAADKFALALLTGREHPELISNTEDFNAPTLAKAVLDVGPKERIEPGILALCYAFQTSTWARSSSALKFIYASAQPVWQVVNRVACDQLNWDVIGYDASSYLMNVLGITHE